MIAKALAAFLSGTRAFILEMPAEVTLEGRPYTKDSRGRQVAVDIVTTNEE